MAISIRGVEMPVKRVGIGTNKDHAPNVQWHDGKAYGCSKR